MSTGIWSIALSTFGKIERLALGIFSEDPNLVLLSPDVADGVWTTREMLEIEQQVATDARDIAIRNLAAEYCAKTAIAKPQERKRLCLEQRKGEREIVIVDTHQPDDFGAWLHRKPEHDEATLARLEALVRDRQAAALRAEYLRAESVERTALMTQTPESARAQSI